MAYDGFDDPWAGVVLKVIHRDDTAPHEKGFCKTQIGKRTFHSMIAVYTNHLRVAAHLVDDFTRRYFARTLSNDPNRFRIASKSRNISVKLMALCSGVRRMHEWINAYRTGALVSNE